MQRCTLAAFPFLFGQEIRLMVLIMAGADVYALHGMASCPCLSEKVQLNLRGVCARPRVILGPDSLELACLS